MVLLYKINIKISVANTAIGFHFLNLTHSTVITISSAGSQGDVVWLLDGDIKYLDRTHIPLFLVALMILILAIAHKIMIFSWQWVIQLPKKWTNNQKLNSLIKTYQAPFNDRHWYWTGLQLLLTLILSFTASRDPNSSIIAMILSLGILVVMAYHNYILVSVFPLKRESILFNRMIIKVPQCYMKKHTKHRSMIDIGIGPACCFSYNCY